MPLFTQPTLQRSLGALLAVGGLCLSLGAQAGGPSDKEATNPPTPEARPAASAPANPAPSLRSTGLIIKYKTPAGITRALSGANFSQYAGQNAAGLGFHKASAAANRLGISLLFDRPLATGAYRLRQSAPLSAEQQAQLIREIAQDPAVEYVEADGWMQKQLVPNDPYYSNGGHWHLRNVTGGINMPPAWDIATGAGVRVAVLDTGINSHSDLNANIVGGYDFVHNSLVGNDGNGRDSNPSDPGDWVTWAEATQVDGFFEGCYPEDSSWHGTHVAGTIAALTNNGLGVSGIAYGAKVVPIRVLGKCGGYSSDIAEAIIWAAGGSVPGVPANPHPARVINMSLGGSGACGPTFQAAINEARNRNALVVVAAGNDDVNTANASPANCEGVLTVAATNESGGKAGFSNFGPHVGIAAPGTNIWSTLNSGTQGPVAATYASYQGTSMATPHVAAVAALVMQQNPGFTANQVAGRLKLGTKPFSAACEQCGAGILNAYQALVPPTFAAGTVFRFFNTNTGIHLFTADPNERDNVLANIPSYQYERTAFKVQFSTAGGNSSVWRFRNTRNGAYLFTMNPAEKAYVESLGYFALDGVAFFARSPASPGSGTIPLHRFQNRNTGSHFYSYSPAEVAYIQNNLGYLYQYEGVSMYVWP